MCQSKKKENELRPEPYEILSITPQTDKEYTFKIKCDKKTRPGQFFQISLPKIGEAPISVSGIGNDWLEFTIRKVGKLTNETFGLAAGDELFLRGPYGNHFPLQKFKGSDVVVVAGGTGVCAVNSLLQHFYKNYSEVGDVYFLTGFRDQQSILYEEELKKYKEKFTDTAYTLDNENIEGFETGFVTECIEMVPFADLDDYHVVIVGPPPMMEAAFNNCSAQNVKEENIWVSLERKMSCGIGKCGHCKIGDKYVCVDGPVFNYTEVKNLID
ncbi:MAG: anaerobic sulfite reductase subunit AsrB [Halanaerobiales bacterium]